MNPDHKKNELYRLRDIRHEYNNTVVLNIPDLTIPEGTATGFIGPNGSGKSTLFRIMAFLENPIHGSVIYRGRKAQGLLQNTALRQEATLLLQEPYLLKRSVFDNIAYGLRIRKETNDLKGRVSEALRDVGLSPGTFSNRQWYQLSGGEAQRVAIASRIILNPRVLILDEPTSNIDQESIELIKETIGRIREKYNTTIVLASHDRIWLNSVADEIHLLHRGSIVGSGIENIITGPWEHFEDELWVRNITGTVKIFAAGPPQKDSIAILQPTEIILSPVLQSQLSARNSLEATITSVTASSEPGKLQVEIRTGGLSLTCLETGHSMQELGLYPGKKVWAIFKSTSFHWQ